LEALYEIKPVARAARPAFKKTGRAPPSAHRLMLQCLIAQPGLGAQVATEWHGEGAEAETVADILEVLREANFTLSSPALMQSFRGTVHERSLAAAEADMLSWGESFDVAAEFAGLLGKLEDGQRRQRFQILQDKLTQGGLASLTSAEREQYLQLATPSQRG